MERLMLMRIMEELSAAELRTFAFLLPDVAPHIPGGKLHDPSPALLAKLLSQYCPETALHVAARVLGHLPRKDLLKKYNLRGAEEESPRPRGASAAAAAGSPSVQEPPLPPLPVQEQPQAEKAKEARQVSEKDLMTLAGNLGKDWKVIGIQFLGVKKSRLEQIEEENPGNAAMRAFYMLTAWRNCERERATTDELFRILSQDGVPLDHDAIEFLRSS